MIMGTLPVDERSARSAVLAKLVDMGDGVRSRSDEGLWRAHQLALSQFGVLRRCQVHELGVAPSTIRKWIRAGTWVPHGRDALALPGLPDDILHRSVILAHRLGLRATLTGPSALAVRGLLGTPPWDALGPMELPWVIARHRVEAPALVLRRDPEPSQWIGGVPLASTRTVMIDLLRFLDEPGARSLAYRASGSGGWQRFMRSLDEICQSYGHHPGAPQLRKIAALMGTGARSDAEQRAQRLLRRAGIVGWQANFRIRLAGRVIIIDIAFPKAKVAIEIDGRAYHGDARFHSDRSRHNLLEEHGWTVLHFTWEHLTEAPDVVVRQVRAALDAHRP